jgi:alkanesulfonate monooxygenase SsuD/methylene tetrahydromethanopterin reductase-like flavin-dependent oxidoreductase (luciferase family)
MSDRRQLALNLVIHPGGHHEAALRYKGYPADRILDVSFYQELTQRAEAHKFDAIFADGPALADNVRYAQRFRFEPITWLAAIAALTRRIGLIATASTAHTEPYNLARLFASLDHLSQGARAGTSSRRARPRPLRISGCPSTRRTTSDTSGRASIST